MLPSFAGGIVAVFNHEQGPCMLSSLVDAYMKRRPEALDQLINFLRDYIMTENHQRVGNVPRRRQGFQQRMNIPARNKKIHKESVRDSYLHIEEKTFPSVNGFYSETKADEGRQRRLTLCDREFAPQWRSEISTAHTQREERESGQTGNKKSLLMTAAGKGGGMKQRLAWNSGEQWVS